MKIALLAIGRMKAGEEKALCERYLARLRQIGPKMGLTEILIREFTESRAATAQMRRQEEAGYLTGAVPEGHELIALDERGKAMTSEKFARFISERLHFAAGLSFVIGGPDGLGETVLQRSGLQLQLGSMTWPHQLARILLLEQLYRAATILSNHPYHRA